MSELDARKQTLLRALIVEYVAGAEPVGSELLVTKYPLGVKSATIRNELAEMSDLGYLEQPHTSAGRIPSDLGYRYFVDRLIVRREPEGEAQQRVLKTAEEGDTLQELLGDVARLLSRLTHLLAVATTVRDPDVTVKTVVLSALGPAQALLVLVLSNGHVENRMIECPVGLTLEDVGRANELLLANLGGKTLKQVGRSKNPLPATGTPVDKLLAAVWSSLRQTTKDLTRGVMVVEGEEYMFAQPEFRNSTQTLTELMDHLLDSDTLYEAVAPPEAKAQLVTIGKENRQNELKQMSVVRRSFFVGENEAGVIALVGPTRMPYEQSIPLVDLTAEALSASLTKTFGP